MQIPLKPGDEVVVASPVYTTGPVVLVVTKHGHVYEVAYDALTNTYVVNVL